MRGVCAAAGAAVVAAVACASEAPAAYLPKQPPVTTPWTAKVSRTAPLPEYPRPQMVRREWRNLNGQWQFRPANAGEPPPFRRALPETVLVPYPLQSALSGIKRQEQRSWYRRGFRVPRGWRGRRVLLHFGAVTHRATVYVNGRRVGSHRGSYDAFSFDVTRALRPGLNELLVRVEDPLAYGGGQPVGKQSVTAVSVVHTASSGIWQTVWLEPVAPAHFVRLDQTPDLRRDELVVVARAAAAGGARVVLRARDGDRVVGRASGRPGRPVRLPVPRPRLWTPERPFLYGLDVELRRGDRVLDRVRSYFGMRSIALRRVGGVVRPVLNGRFVFQTGPLDQGYWPDGLYTAPTDEALRFDIAKTKRLGFNMTRKHVKVEPQRWYHWADRLGLLVWQDMPNMSIYRRVQPADKPRFERELRAMVDQHRSSPAIVTWVPFNEGWGQYDVARITALVKRWDRSRLVDAHSGSANCCRAREPRNTDIRDGHIYQGPMAPAPDHRASAIGEFSACRDSHPRHEDTTPGMTGAPGVAPPASVRANAGILRRAWAALRQQMRTPGLSAAVYTQYANVEHEIGAGLVSNDRRATYCGAGLLRRLNRGLIAASRRVAALRPQSGAVPSGTSALWTFDEGSGGMARDAGRGGRHLRLEGGAGWAGGRRGRALAVSGAGQQAAASGPVVETRGSFTVSAWVRYAAPARPGTAVGQGAGFSLGLRVANDRPDLDTGYAIERIPGPFPQPKWNMAVPRSGDCATQVCSVRANAGYGDRRIDPAPQRWYHVTGVVDRRDRAVSLFVDGVAVDNRILEGGAAAAARFTVGAGALGAFGPDAFAGRVDQVRVYARALRADEVWRLYRAEGGRP
jgi:hypothetical protein